MIKPDKIILVDYPGFNLRLAKKIKKLKLGIPITYFILPQLWAWKENRIKLMKKTIDQSISIFPFETDWYNSKGLVTFYAGHPFIEKEYKTRGSEKGIKSNKTEAGSIQGKGYQKVTCLNCVEPKYPKLAIKRGYEGVLKLEILILKSGIVKEVFIRESTGFEILDKAGVNAAFKSKFYPLTKKTNLNIEYTLQLNQR